MSEGVRARSNKDSTEVPSLQSSLENLGILFENSQTKVQELKMQMVYQQDAVKDAEVESTMPRKKLRKVEDDS